jgi:uncharacterized delta-60 repeat protein
MNQPKPVSPGTLDPTFCKNGVRYFPDPAVYGMPSAVIALPDNKSLVVMDPPVQDGKVIVARLNEDGALDTTFGPAQYGYVEVFIDATEVNIYGLSSLANGGWLMVGQFIRSGRDSGLLVVRQLQDGQLDKSLNGDGILFIPFAEIGNSQYASMEVEASRFNGKNSLDAAPQATGNAGMSAIEQSDGKIVLVTAVRDAQRRWKGIVLRRNADGSRDETFNGDGFAIVELKDVEHKDNFGSGVAVQTGGQVLVCGLYDIGNGFMGAYVTCFTSTGSIDKSFNNGLAVTVLYEGWIDLHTITVSERDGKIVAVGNARSNRAQKGLVVVLNKSGSYNLLFNNGEALFSEVVPQGHDWLRCALKPDGNIIVTGTTGNGSITDNPELLTAHYRPDGKLDPTFNSGKGYTVHDEEQGIAAGRDMAVMADGRILVCGNLYKDAEPQPYIIGGLLLRYLG